MDFNALMEEAGGKLIDAGLEYEVRDGQVWVNLSQVADGFTFIVTLAPMAQAMAVAGNRTPLDKLEGMASLISVFHAIVDEALIRNVPDDPSGLTTE